MARSVPPLRMGSLESPLILELPLHGNFNWELHGADKTTGEPLDWPAGTQLTLHFDDAGIDPWATSEIVGPIARWSKTKAITDPVPDLTEVRLQYVNGTDDYPLWKGVVNRGTTA